MMAASIREVLVTSGGESRRPMPVVGMGTASHPLGDPGVKWAVVEAIQLGYRHFDTAALYQSEESVGEAIAEALRLGLIKSRDELFVTSKLWCSDNHRDLVLPALQKSLRNLRLDYLDLYLIHYPIRSKQGSIELPIKKEDLFPLDLKSVWEAMEECHRLGLAKSIGVSNFSCNDVDEILPTATIRPAVNQVELHPLWQQKEMRMYFQEKDIHVTAYSPLGGQDMPSSRNRVMECDVLKEIAQARGKTVAQVCLRWLYEQGVSIVVRSFNRERMEQNLQIFNWELSEEERSKISQIEQIQKYPLDVVFDRE